MILTEKETLIKYLGKAEAENIIKGEAQVRADLLELEIESEMIRIDKQIELSSTPEREWNFDEDIDLLFN